MAKINVPEWSTTPGSNLDLNSISVAEGWLPSTVNNFMREMISQVAKFYDSLGGVVTVGGTANAITITTTEAHVALATGLLVAFKNSSGPNTAATTVNVDGLGAKAVRLQGDVALAGGELLDDGIYLLRYDAAYNAAAGAWVVLNPSDTDGSRYLIQETAGSVTATLDFFSLPAGYSSFELEIDGLGPATDDDSLRLRVQTGGTTVQTTGYAYGNVIAGSGGTPAGFGSGAASDNLTTSIGLTQLNGSAVAVGNQTAETVRGRAWFNPSDTNQRRHFDWKGIFVRPDTTEVSVMGGGVYGSSSAITGVRLLWGTGGNFRAQGSARLWGIR